MAMSQSSGKVANLLSPRNLPHIFKLKEKGDNKVIEATLIKTARHTGSSK
jgi:hypothetical protein